MSEILCPNCHAPNRDTAKFCSECGTPFVGGTTPNPTSGSETSGASEKKSSADAGQTHPDASSATAAESQSPTGASRSVNGSVIDLSGLGEAGSDRDSASREPAGEPPETSEKLETGKVVLGRYKLGEQLGRGGFGAVYRAWDANLNRPCAIKINLDASPEASRQFAREASVLANLSHPNLPRVTDHVSIPGQGQYLVMDFVQGEDLDHMVRREKMLPVEKALEWMTQVANALVYLHSRNPAVIHRDIKPANIRITPDEQAMLVDFGLVKMLDPVMKTTMGARAVTPGYAPPEQYGMGRTDARSDIYAMGATLYKILTGREPLESVLRAAGQKMPAAHEVNPQVPAPLTRLVDKAMALDPAQRFQSAVELRDALRGINLSGVEAPAVVSRNTPASQSAPAVSRDTGLPRPADRPADHTRTSQREIPRSGATQPPRRGPWMWVAGGAVLFLIVCLAVAGAWALLNRPKPTPTSAALLGATTEPASFDSTETPQSATESSVGTEAVVATEESGTQATASATPLPPTATADPNFLSKDRTAYLHTTDGDPDTLDPALSYTTYGLAVIQNLYDTLVFYNREDPNTFIPQLAVEVPSVENGGISADGLVYTFKIRSGVQFHDGSLLTPEDVAYTFRRNLLQGGSFSPMLLLTEPILGVGVYDVAELVGPDLVDNPQGLIQADAAKRTAVCQQVVDAIQFDNAAGTVTFRLAQPWAPFLSTLSGAWGGIRSKAWTVANGGWDGDCATWQSYYAPTLEEQNRKKIGAQEMGTGPYKLETWKQGDEIVLTANESYWRTEPAWPGGPSGAPALKRVVIRDLFNLSDRLPLAQSGDADSLVYASNADWPTLESLTGLVCKLSDNDCEPSANSSASLESLRGLTTSTRSWDILFNWDMAADGNALIGSGKLDGKGVPANFFSDVHVRKAFATCFNYQSYLIDVQLGEGVRAITVIPPGMLGYDANAPYYRYDPEKCGEELRQAQFDGKSVWDAGFTLTLPYAEGQLGPQKIAENFKKEFAALDARFVVNVDSMPVDQYFNLQNAYKLPYTHISWLEDIHDPHNWVVPYSVANQAFYAHLSPELTNRFKEIINRGVVETDSDRRAAIYAEFNQIYYDNVPAILLYQSVGRHYQQRWVRGWFNNPVLPGLYFYVLSKD